MLKFMNRREFAATLTGVVNSMLGETELEDGGEGQFNLRPCDFGLVLAQSLLPRLLLFGMADIAAELLAAMEALLVADHVPLHWLMRFTAKYRPQLSPPVTEILVRILRKLPHADALFVTGEDAVFRICGLLVKRDALVIQDPDVVNREFHSPFHHAHAFAVCALSLSPEKDDVIAARLADPLFDSRRIWPQRDNACILLAGLASSLAPDIAYAYFAALVGGRRCAMAVHAGHCFLLNIGTSLLKKIATDARVFIGGDDRKLEYFLHLMKPAFQRLEGAPKEAAMMLTGILESVAESTPRVLQEMVVDVLTLCYLDLQLQPWEDALRAAIRRLLGDLRVMAESVFELGPG
jgi:hypothetical protein